MSATNDLYDELEAKYFTVKQQLTETKQALAALVEAKDHKDLYGKTTMYLTMKEQAWEKAREILSK